LKPFSVIISFIVFALLLAAGPLVLMQTGHGALFVPQFWQLYGFVTTLTFIAIASILIGQVIKPDYFAQFFLIATVVKMLVCLVFLLIFVLKFKVNKAAFVGDFIYLYFLNTAFEVYVLLRNLRNQNLK